MSFITHWVGGAVNWGGRAIILASSKLLFFLLQKLERKNHSYYFERLNWKGTGTFLNFECHVFQTYCLQLPKQKHSGSKKCDAFYISFHISRHSPVILCNSYVLLKYVVKQIQILSFKNEKK